MRLIPRVSSRGARRVQIGAARQEPGHSRENGNPGPRAKDWVPAFAGTSGEGALTKTGMNDYRCGGGSSRQAWVSPWASLPHGDQKLPHLSQPASMAPSTISKAMRAAALPLVRSLAFDVASMNPLAGRGASRRIARRDILRQIS